MPKSGKKVRQGFRRISLVDRFLMLYMLILLGYLVLHLFTGMENTQTIDVVVRTSMAAIFGYFISGNFAKSGGDTTPQPSETTAISLPINGTETSTVKNQIGFQTAAVSSNNQTGQIIVSDTPPLPAGFRRKTQVVVVSIIGLISLALLFVIGQIQHVTPELTAVMSQLRDFLSACIGFLVSCGKDATD